MLPAQANVLLTKPWAPGQAKIPITDMTIGTWRQNCHRLKKLHQGKNMWHLAQSTYFVIFPNIFCARRVAWTQHTKFKDFWPIYSIKSFLSNRWDTLAVRLTLSLRYVCILMSTTRGLVGWLIRGKKWHKNRTKWLAPPNICQPDGKKG